MKFAIQVIAAIALVATTEYVIVNAAFGTLHSLVNSQPSLAASRS